MSKALCKIYGFIFLLKSLRSRDGNFIEKDKLNHKHNIKKLGLTRILIKQSQKIFFLSIFPFFRGVGGEEVGIHVTLSKIENQS
jgi:hypothetical protein